MKRNTSTKKNLVYNIIYQITILILPLITAPYLARIIGAEGVGIFSYYDSITKYFIYFAMLGVLNYGNRTIAKSCDNEEELNKTYSSIYYLQLITSFVVLIGFLIYVLFISKNKLISSIFMIYYLSTFFDVSWLFFGLQEFKTTSIRQIIIRVINFLLIIFLVNKKTDLNLYILIMCLGNFVSAFSLWIISWKRIKLCKCSFKEIFKHFKPCLILFIPIIATSIYRVMDIIMVGKLTNMNEVGYYENSQKLIHISLGLIASFSAVIMPRISNLLANKQIDKAKKMFDDSMEIALIIGFALGFGILSIANEFVPIYFGKEFMPSIVLTIGLSTTVPVITWACIVRTLYLIPAERDKIYVESVIIGAVLNFICNIILIIKIGTIGAVIGTIIAEFSVAIYQTIFSKKDLNIKKYLKQALIFASFGLIMLVVVRLIAKVCKRSITGLLVEIVFGAIVYSLLALLYLTKTNNEYLKFYVNKFKRIIKLK